MLKQVNLLCQKVLWEESETLLEVRKIGKIVFLTLSFFISHELIHALMASLLGIKWWFIFRIGFVDGTITPIHLWVAIYLPIGAHFEYLLITLTPFVLTTLAIFILRLGKYWFIINLFWCRFDILGVLLR